MATPAACEFDLESTYVNLVGGDAATRLEVTEDFWPRLVAGEYDVERLMGVLSIDRDTHWEMHPEGEELLTVLTGRMVVVLEEPGGEREIELPAGKTCLLPRGTWHRLCAKEPGRLLFITAGKDTQMRPL